MNAKRLMIVVFIVVVITGAVYFLNARNAFKVNTNQTAVVKEIQALNKLETAQFTIEKIIDAQTNTDNIFEQILSGDKIILIAHGEVVAGFDLSKMLNDNVTVRNDILTVQLPEPEILYTKIDNDKTKVYDRQQGLLTKGNKDLESEARKSAEQSITAAACEAGILDQAKVNGEKQIKTMFSRFGYKDVIIEIPQGNCPGGS